MDDKMLDRAQGCLLGQLTGDALGSLVEFQSALSIALRYPDGLRDLQDGGTYNTLAGQPTDDSEMALMLARLLVAERRYDPDRALERYRYWFHSGPFDYGFATRQALTDRPDTQTQANGALMRISPLGIFGVGKPRQALVDWARQDAYLTHPHPICQQVNVLFVLAIADAIEYGLTALGLHERIRGLADDIGVDPSVSQVIEQSSDSPPADYLHHQGWVLIAFHNALWQLLHAESAEAAIIDSAMRGGDTDTNAAICGALLGAVHGRASIPQRWQDKLLQCRPEARRPGVHRPRPRPFWPVDALELAENLLRA